MITNTRIPRHLGCTATAATPALLSCLDRSTINQGATGKIMTQPKKLMPGIS